MEADTPFELAPDNAPEHEHADFLWRYDSEQGMEVPPPIVQDYLDNLVMVGGLRLTDRAWAAENGVNDRTLRRWKRDPRFRKLWAKAADESVLGPDSLNPIYQAAMKIAADPDHPKWDAASKMILGLADKIRPPQVHISIRPEDQFAGMTDEELAKFLERGREVIQLGPVEHS